VPSKSSLNANRLREADDRVVLRLGVLVAVPRELDARPDEDRAEDDEREREGRQRCGADGDEDRPQHERKDHSDEQHPLVQLGRHGELREDDDEHEEVVDAQRLLHQVRGEVLRPDVAALPQPDADAERHRDADVEDRPQQRFPEPHLVRLVADGHEVQDDQSDDAGDRHGPQAESYVHPSIMSERRLRSEIRSGQLAAGVSVLPSLRVA